MSSVITIDVALWGLVVGTILPILVGVVTKSSASGGVKAVTLAALAAATVIIQEAVSAGSFDVKPAVLKFALLFLTAVGLHFGFLKPAQVTGAGGAAGKLGPQ